MTKKEFQRNCLERSWLYFLIFAIVITIVAFFIDYELGNIALILSGIFSIPAIFKGLDYRTISSGFDEISEPTWELYAKIIETAEYNIDTGMYVTINSKKINIYSLLESFTRTELVVLRHAFDIAKDRVMSQKHNKNKELSLKFRQDLVDTLCKK